MVEVNGKYYESENAAKTALHASKTLELLEKIPYITTNRMREITLCKYGKLQSPTGQVQAQSKRSTSRLLVMTPIILKMKAVVTDRISMPARL